MKYIRLQNNIVVEIIPIEATIPDIETWYGKEFALQCIEVSDEIVQDMLYNPKTKTFYNNNKIEIINQISILKEQLSSTDYKAIKFAEGWITEEEYLPTKTERQSLRDQINTLEQQL